VADPQQVASLPRPARRTSPGGALGLSLLRGFELASCGQALPVPPSTQRVLAFLALQARPVTRVFVAGSLWIEASEEHAGAALRTALWRLQPHGSVAVRARGQTLALDERLRVDLAIVGERAHAVLDGAPVERADVALLCDAGELLPDWYEDWVIVERERFRQLRLHALEQLCRWLTAAGRYAEATATGVAAVASEPLRESAHRVLVAAHLAEGNVCEGLRQYDRCRELLRRDLSVAPSPLMEALVAGVRNT
jgi:DNA-binding SARP family transcriptional activator